MEGICASCPKHCKTCAIDTVLKESYLVCRVCNDGYSGVDQCTLNKTRCNNFKNCAICDEQNGVQICLKCSPFYALSSNQLQCIGMRVAIFRNLFLR
jgi:hypothetical protein